MPLAITSPAFEHEGEIPKLYTCQGKDISPALAWTGAPAGTKSFVLIVDDPDAPDPKAPKLVWVHWVLYNLASDTPGLPEGAGGEPPPAGAGAGWNDFKRTAYGGPCPPIGRHRYYFKLYALDSVLRGLTSKAGKNDVLAAMKGHVLAEAVLMGTYEKS